MNPHIFLPIISYLGLACGIALAYIAPEELDDGKRYFLILQNIIFGIVFAIGMESLLMGLTVGVLGFLIMSFFDFKKIFVTKVVIAYVLLGYGTVVGSYIMIFLFGFPTGSLLIHQKVSYKKIILITAPYLILSYLYHFSFLIFR